MSRSVSYLNHAKKIIYFTADWVKEDFDYEDFYEDLINAIQKKLKSYIKSDKFDNRETKIILENNLCIIGLSEYCGAWSLSLASKEEDYYLEYNREALAVNHASQIEATLEKCLLAVGAKVMNRVATFTNGEAVFEYKK